MFLLVGGAIATCLNQSREYKYNPEPGTVGNFTVHVPGKCLAKVLQMTYGSFQGPMLVGDFLHLKTFVEGCGGRVAKLDSKGKEIGNLRSHG